MTMYNNKELNESDHNEAQLKEKTRIQIYNMDLSYFKMIAELAAKG